MKQKPHSYTHPKGELNRARVLELLKKNWTVGIRQKEIIEKLNLTKPTVNDILKELLSEYKIYKLNNMYYPEFDDDFIFSYFISDFISFFLIELMKNKEIIANLAPSLVEFKLTEFLVEDSSRFGGYLKHPMLIGRKIPRANLTIYLYI